MSSPQPKIADRLRTAIRLRGYSYRTEQAYLQWYVRYVRFHRLRHPAEMGEPEVKAFLGYLATALAVSASVSIQGIWPHGSSARCHCTEIGRSLRQGWFQAHGPESRGCG